MAKERPVPSGRQPTNSRDRQAGPDYPARPREAPATPGPRRPTSGGPSDPRPIAATFIQRPPGTAPENRQTAGAPGPDLRNDPSAAASGTQRAGSPNSSVVAGYAGRPGNQRNSGPSGARRVETAGAARVPPTRPPLPGLHLQPMVHVGDMAASVDFYVKLGGEVIHGGPDDEWVLMQVGTAQIGLVTRPPNAYRGEGTVELNFAATMPLDRLEQLLLDHGLTAVEVARDGDLGMLLRVETPDGMPIKIHQVEPDLMV
jgi:hypothetical protein